MPEGHTVHRVARQLALDFVGHRLSVSSPQGRFAAGARRLDGHVLVDSHAVGKQLFLTVDSGDVLRVHLGLYGAWDLNGVVSPLTDGAAVPASLGAPRRSVRIGESEVERPASAGGGNGSPGLSGSAPLEVFPPAPVGQVRVRLATSVSVADLRGPTACEVLDPAAAQVAVARLGPDPAIEEDLDAAGAVVVARLTTGTTPIGRLLMDQSVVAGIGNIYRAELLFRAGLDPWTPARRVPSDVAWALWRDWAVLLAEGIRTGIILTRELDAAELERSHTDRELRFWVYRRAGEPCRVCGTPVVVEAMSARKLYRCPRCQV